MFVSVAFSTSGAFIFSSLLFNLVLLLGKSYYIQAVILFLFFSFGISLCSYNNNLISVVHFLAAALKLVIFCMEVTVIN